MMIMKTGFAKGVTIGIVTGAALGMALAPKGKNSKSAAGKVLKAAGEVVENISGRRA